MPIIVGYLWVLKNNDIFKKTYDEWYKESVNKCSISKMIELAKQKEPNLKVLGIQEYKLDNPIVVEPQPQPFSVITNKEKFNECNTQGAFIIF